MAQYRVITKTSTEKLQDEVNKTINTHKAEIIGPMVVDPGITSCTLYHQTIIIHGDNCQQ